MAHPGSVWGIDMSSVVSLRDQARVAARAQAEEANPDDEPHQRLERVRTIVIDPGHGGDNSGAIGVTGVPEKYLTMELAYQLREQLQERYPELRVILTRYWDTSMELTDRVHLANLANADLFVSLHYNAAPHDRAVGYETYFLDADEVTPGHHDHQGLPLASTDPSMTGVQAPIEGVEDYGHEGDVLQLIEQDLLRAHQHDLSAALAETVQNQFRDHLGTIDRGVKQANFKVLRGAHMPAILVEAGFMTHPEEGVEVFRQDHRDQVSQALLTAVETFDGHLADRLDEAERNAHPEAGADRALESAPDEEAPGAEDGEPTEESIDPGEPVALRLLQ